MYTLVVFDYFSRRLTSFHQYLVHNLFGFLLKILVGINIIKKGSNPPIDLNSSMY